MSNDLLPVKNYRCPAALPSAGCRLPIGDMRLRAHSHGDPSHSRSICAISAVENMEVGTYHFTWGSKAQVTWGQSVQSQPLRAWKLGLTTSHGVPSPKSLEINLCNLSHWEHGSWDLPLYMGSQGPSHLRSIYAIPTVESMEVGTYHFHIGSQVSSHLRSSCAISTVETTWKLGLTTSHGIPSSKSQVWHGCLHANIFWRRGKKLDPTLNTNLMNFFAWNNQYPPWMTIHQISMVSWRSIVGTC